MSCTALASFLLAQPFQDCSSLQLNLALRGTEQLPQTGIHQTLVLHRLGLRTAISKDQFSARLFLSQFQTGGEASYIGIGGESIVLRVETAELRYQPASSLQISAGIVENLWIESETLAWGLRNLEKNLAEEYQWATRGEPGLSILYRFPKDYGFAISSITTGEGAFRRERNNGKNTAGLLTLYPFASPIFGFSLYGQDGSYGLLSSRNHRIGGRLTSKWNTGHTGLSLIKAWGLSSDINDTPLLWTVWGTQELLPRFSAVLRAGQTIRISSQTDLFTAISFSPQPQTSLSIGWKGIITDEQSSQIAGSTVEKFQQQIFVQMNGRLETQ